MGVREETAVTGRAAEAKATQPKVAPNVRPT